MKIHLLGDSLVQTRQSGHGKFYRGWGDMLSAFVSSEINIINYAMGGRSCRSFLNEGRFYDNGRFTTKNPPFGVGPALEKIQEGDYAFIQFMCNDDDSTGIAYRINRQVSLGNPNETGTYPTIVPHKDMLTDTKNWNESCYRESLIMEGHSENEVEKIVQTTIELIEMCGKSFYPYEAEATYKGYLKFYIDKIRECGAIPILVISGAKHIFVNSKIEPLKGYYGGKDKYYDFPYVEAQKQLAKEMTVDLIDLFNIEKRIYESLGEEKAALFHNMSIDTGDVEKIDNLKDIKEGISTKDWIYDFENRYYENNYISIDNVHKNHFGAFFQAALITDYMLKNGIMKDKIKAEPEFSPGLPNGLKDEKEVFSSLEYVRLWSN